MRRTMLAVLLLALMIARPCSALADGGRFVLHDPYGGMVLVDESGALYTPKGVYADIWEITWGDCAPEDALFAAWRWARTSKDRNPRILLNAFGEEVAELPGDGWEFDPASGLVTFSKNDRYGLLDARGTVLVDAVFEQLEPDGEGGFLGTLATGDSPEGPFRLARYGSDGSRVDTGRDVQYLDGFSDGLAAVEGADGLWGLVRADGEIALPMEYAGIDDIEAGEDVFLVYRDNFRTAQLLDRHTFAVVAEISNELFPEGLATWGSGWIAPGLFHLEWIEQRVVKETTVIDASGNKLFRTEGMVESLYHCNEACGTPEALALRRDNGYFLVNLHGETVGGPYPWLEPYVAETGESLFYISRENSPWGPSGIGVIDTRGAEILPQIYWEVFYLGEGRYLVGLGDELGVVDEQGAEVLPIAYDRLYSLGDGLFEAYQGDRSGIVDIDGNWRISFSKYEIPMD